VEDLDIMYRNPLEKIEEAIKFEQAEFDRTKVLNLLFWKDKIQCMMKVVRVESYHPASGTVRITRDSLLYPLYLKEKNEEYVYTNLKDYFSRLVQTHADRTMLLCWVEHFIIKEEYKKAQHKGTSKHILKQIKKVQNLKSSKADKSIINREENILSNLKKDYKVASGGEDWEPPEFEVAENHSYSDIYENENPDPIVKEIFEKYKKQGLKRRYMQELLDFERNMFQYVRLAYERMFGYSWISMENRAANAKKAALISEEIRKQGDKVRDLKSSKADKSIIDQEVNVLLSLKSDYKNATGRDWKPTDKVASTESNTTSENKEVLKAEKISEEIRKQGDKVRNLKISKADNSILAQEVKILLSLKSDYKNATGQDWKPADTKVASTKNNTTSENKEVSKAEKISEEIRKQGDKVQNLKSSKADKSIIDQEVKILLNLKSDYKNATGQDWKPADIKVVSTESNTTPENKEVSKAEKISEEIRKHGDKVQDVRRSEIYKSLKDHEEMMLLMTDYKKATNKDWKFANSDAPSKKEKQNIPKSGKTSKKEVAKNANSKEADSSKTGTRLGLEAKKEENFNDWYSQVITKSGMIEYYDVSGCYILRPWSFSIWKIIKEFIDKKITDSGVQECYFPIFVTRSVLEKEKAHIADFAPEVAWVTKYGENNLAESIAIRPTSETIMYPAYAKWLKSDTELPLRLNQWNNVVVSAIIDVFFLSQFLLQLFYLCLQRWEFKDPKPFLRTREFLWQEGHTAFATKEEAEEEVLMILDLYARVYEDLLAVPVIKGRKTEKEKFAGGDYTTTVEAFIPTNGRAIQGATSHYLGQNFSKMFNIQVEGIADGEEKTFVYQNSWGLTTRTIGVMIMVLSLCAHTHTQNMIFYISYALL